MFFYAIDGDDVGRKLERLILEEKINEVSLLSFSITASVNQLQKYMQARGADIIFCAGDGLLAMSHEIIDVEPLLNINEDITFSIGIGETSSNALLALKKAKGLGKARKETQFTIAQ